MNTKLQQLNKELDKLHDMYEAIEEQKQRMRRDYRTFLNSNYSLDKAMDVIRDTGLLVQFNENAVGENHAD